MSTWRNFILHGQSAAHPRRAIESGAVIDRGDAALLMVLVVIQTASPAVSQQEQYERVVEENETLKAEIRE